MAKNIHEEWQSPLMHFNICCVNCVERPEGFAYEEFQALKGKGHFKGL